MPQKHSHKKSKQVLFCAFDTQIAQFHAVFVTLFSKAPPKKTFLYGSNRKNTRKAA